jgi:hypothetical protein
MSNKKGQYTRKHFLWTPDNWDDGFIDNYDGRFRVYRPDCPHSGKKNGYTRRAHAIWWLATGQPVPKGFILHHINKNELDDRLDNLCLMTRGDHTYLHIKKDRIKLICAHCGSEFDVYPNDVSHAKYCSVLCRGRASTGANHSSKLHPESVPRGEKSGKAKLKEETVRYILRRYFIDGHSIRGLARELGVGGTTVWNIVAGKNWGFIQDEMAGTI